MDDSFKSDVQTSIVRQAGVGMQAVLLVCDAEITAVLRKNEPNDHIANTVTPVTHTRRHASRRLLAAQEKWKEHMPFTMSPPCTTKPFTILWKQHPL